VSHLASFGGSVTFPPAIIRTLQIIVRLIGMASSDQKKYEAISEDPWFIFAGMMFSLPLIYFSMQQYQAVWAGKSEKSSTENASNQQADNAPRVIVDQPSSVVSLSPR
jgi:hypothetical protein